MLLVLLYALLNLIHASVAVNIYLIAYIYSLCHSYPGHLFQALVVSLSDIKKETDYVVGLHNIELLFGSSPL